LVKTIEESIRKYFIKYKRRYPHKSNEDALKATRNWIEGLIKGTTKRPLDETTKRLIDNKLKELERVS